MSQDADELFQIFDTSGLNVIVGPKGLKKGDELSVSFSPSLLTP